jgi:hypothetical protein
MFVPREILRFAMANVARTPMTPPTKIASPKTTKSMLKLGAMMVTSYRLGRGWLQRWRQRRWAAQVVTGAADGSVLAKEGLRE